MFYNYYLVFTRYCSLFLFSFPPRFTLLYSNKQSDTAMFNRWQSTLCRSVGRVQTVSLKLLLLVTIVYDYSLCLLMIDKGQYFQPYSPLLRVPCLAIQKPFDATSQLEF